MKRIERFSPAKINLTLHILGRRPDGFHELETRMVPLTVGDRMVFREEDSGIGLDIRGRDLEAGPTNLVWRAAEAVRREAGITRGVHVTLDKRLPLGGGLAGGSSNAAVTLHACNQLWEAGLDSAALHRLAATLGSDVNFFLGSGPALCRGRGEIIEPCAVTLPGPVLLMNPGFEVPTPWAFQTYAAMEESGRRGTETFIPSANLRLRNDLEPAVMSKYLWIAEAKEWLAALPGVLGALMSGSGATVFALLEAGADGPGLLRRAREWAGPNSWIELADPLPPP